MIWNPFSSKPKSVYDNIGNTKNNQGTETYTSEQKAALDRGLRRTYTTLATSPDLVAKHGVSALKRTFTNSNRDTLVSSEGIQTLVSKGANKTLNNANKNKALADLPITKRFTMSQKEKDQHIAGYNDKIQEAQDKKNIDKIQEAQDKKNIDVTSTKNPNMQQLEIGQEETKADNIKKSFIRRFASGEMPVASAAMNMVRRKSTDSRGRGQ